MSSLQLCGIYLIMLNLSVREVLFYTVSSNCDFVSESSGFRTGDDRSLKAGMRGVGN